MRWRSSCGALERLEHDADRVGHLLEGPPEDLLADQLGEHLLERDVGVPVGLVEERPGRKQADEVVDERPHAGPGPRRDGEDLGLTGDQLGRVDQGLGLAVGLETVHLVDGDRDRHAGAHQGLGDVPVARPDALLAVEHQECGVGVGHLADDASLHPRRQRVPRTLDAREVDEHELPVRVRARGRGSPGGSSGAGRRRSRPWCRRSRSSASTCRRSAGRRARRTRRGSPREELALDGQHLAVVALVIHADEVEHAVDDRLAEIGGVLGADHDVAELAGTARSRRPRRSGTTGRRSDRPCRDARR